MSQRLLTGLQCLLLFFVTSMVCAVDRDWTNTSGLLFYDTGANWNPSQTPTLADNVTFDIDVSDPIIIGANSNAFNVNVTDNDWEFTGEAGGLLDSDGITTINDAFGTTLANGTNLAVTNNLTWNNAGNIVVGDTGYGSLTIQDSSNVDGLQIFVGNTATGVGEITLTGDNTSLTARLLSNSGIYTIGRGGGTGTVNVEAGADLRTTSTAGNDIWVGGHLDDDDVAATTSTGTLNVDGVGSFVETEDLNVGIFGGNGTLNITNGGQVINTDGSSPDTSFGANDGFGGLKSSGSGLVDGDGSLLESRAILVGNSGMGRLDVRAGAVTRTAFESASLLGDFHIGLNAGSDGKVAVHGSGVSDSLLDVDDSLKVGDAGLGVLNIGRDLDDNEIGSGAVQVDVDLIIGDDAGNNLDNKVIVSGANATANIGRNLTAGGSGKGTFEARNGANVTVTTGVNVGLAGGGNGTLLLDGAGTTLAANRLFVGNGSGSGSTGLMTVSGGAVATFTGADNTGTGTVEIGDDDEGVGTLTVTGAGSKVETTNALGGWFIGGSPNESGGTGTVNIVVGGRGISAARVVLGHGTADNSGSSGTLVVDGTGSQFDANGDFILVGFRGVGNMDVTGGGVVNADNIFVADAVGSAGSQVDIDNAGSVVNLDGLLHVGDTVRGTLNVTGGGQLNVAMDGVNDRLIIGDESGADGSILSVTGAGSRVDYFGTDRVSVGFSGGSIASPAELQVLEGGVLQAVQRNPDQTIASQARLVVGDQTGSNGKLTIDGPGSRVEAQFMNVGEDGTGNGTVNITDGGLLELTQFAEIGAGGTGTSAMTVSGSSSQFDVAGDLSMGAASGGTASGTLNVSDGGAVTTGDQGFIGRFTGNVGVVNVGGGTGALATWQVENGLFIAGTDNITTAGGSQISGSGTLNVLAGGLVQVDGLTAIKDRGVITLDGGELATDDILFQDFASRSLSPTFNFNTGNLHFTDGAGFTLDAALLENVLGTHPTLVADQHLTIDNAAVLSSPLRLNGGTFSVGSITAANLANLDWDAGTLQITNQQLSISPAGPLGQSVVIDVDQTLNLPTTGGIVLVQPNSDLNVIRGALNIVRATNDGLIVISNTMDVDFNSDNNATGLTNNEDLVLINSTVAGDIVNNGRIETVGPSTLLDSLTLNSGGTLGIDLDGLLDFDSIIVGGDATLDGLLSVSLSGGFAPSPGEQFTVLTASSISNNGLALGGSAASQFDLLVSGSNVILRAIGGTDVDLDNDGDVDGGDFLAIQRTNPTLIPAWQSQYGSGSLSAATGAVPEPSSLLLAVLGVAFYAIRPASKRA